MAKLLYLVHRIPYPPNKGDKIRSFHFLKALAKHYEIFLGTFIDDPLDKQYAGELQAYCAETCCIDLSPLPSKIKSLRGFVSGEALSLPYYRNQQLQDWTDEVIDNHGIDRVLIFSSPMAQYVEKYPDLYRIADFVDVDSDKWRQYADSKSWPASWVYHREAKQLLGYEIEIAKQVNETFFVSEQEAQLFKTLAPEVANKIGFVNNGVDTVFFDPNLSFDNPYPQQQPILVFTGAMDYWANVDAVCWFAQQVLPIITTVLPQVRFYIVGSKPTKEVQLLAQNDPAVIVTGRVDDVRQYLAHALAVVAPLRIARGIQNKVLEAMAMAKPVIATSAAMEGISVVENLVVAIADNEQVFADQVISYITNAYIEAKSNRNFVESQFGWQQNGQKLCDLLEKRDD